MLHNKNKAIDHTWSRIFLGPNRIECSKFPLKDKLTIAKTRRIGSRVVFAFTRGIYEAEDTVVEMSSMDFYGQFLPYLGATEINGALVNPSDIEFELVETISDPAPLGAGDVTNIAQGCKVIGFEKNTEATEAESMVSVTVAIKTIKWGATSKGGAGASLAV